MMATQHLCQSILGHQCNTGYPRMLQCIMATQHLYQSIQCNTEYPTMLQRIIAIHPLCLSILSNSNHVIYLKSQHMYVIIYMFKVHVHSAGQYQKSMHHDIVT